MCSPPHTHTEPRSEIRKHVLVFLIWRHRHKDDKELELKEVLGRTSKRWEKVLTWKQHVLQQISIRIKPSHMNIVIILIR